MLRPCPPKTNAQRQREFRERNPGYYQRLHAKRRTMIAASLAQRRESEAAMAVMFAKLPLMLPAPVETIEIPGMTTIDETIRSREAIEVSVRA
jgi:hypothetical protein